MTKLQIISRLWSHIGDLRLLLDSTGTKTRNQIEKELDETELYCRRHTDTDDPEE